MPGSRKTLFLESVAGVAGDMFAAAFLDAGILDPAEAAEVPERLGLEGVHLEIGRVRRATMDATHLRVVVPPELGGHHHTHFRDLDRRLEGSGLDPAAVDFSREVLRRIAEAEAGAHGTSTNAVAFHEVGEPDSLVDVALAGLCVARSGTDRVVATPLKPGRGLVRIHHGTHPVPPPGSARLLAGLPVAAVPEAIVEEDVELSTPTGIAILAALGPTFVDGWPAGRVVRQGMGAGTRDLSGYPNVFRVVVLEGREASVLPYATDSVVELACNVDDQTGERTAWLLRRCLEIGALDAWTHQVVGKKGRPALVLSLLAPPEALAPLADWLLRQGSTFGVRHRPWDRLKLLRSEEVRREEGPGGVAAPVRYSVGRTTTGEVVKEKPEFDDLERLWDAPGAPGS
jgi:pyridinium-3,5-bisthiocarboxylic acid mononucleotide nickel chelatase